MGDRVDGGVFDRDGKTKPNPFDGIDVSSDSTPAFRRYRRRRAASLLMSGGRRRANAKEHCSSEHRRRRPSTRSPRKERRFDCLAPEIILDTSGVPARRCGKETGSLVHAQRRRASALRRRPRGSRSTTPFDKSACLREGHELRQLDVQHARGRPDRGRLVARRGRDKVYTCECGQLLGRICTEGHPRAWRAASASPGTTTRRSTRAASRAGANPT